MITVLVEPTWKCMECRQPFPLSQLWAVSSYGRFCSLECYDSWHKKHVSKSYRSEARECKTCGEVFVRFLSQNAPCPEFCCHKCRWVWKKANDPDRLKPRVWYPVAFDADLREQIRNRDHHTCAMCGEKYLEGRFCHVHHIDYDKTNLALTNFITLCNKCHASSSQPINHEEYQERLTWIMRTRYTPDGQKLLSDL